MRSQIAQLALFLLSAGAFVLAAHLLVELRWLQRLTWLFLIIGGIYVAAQIIPSIWHSIMPLLPMGASGSLFWTWLVAMAFSQGLANRKLSMRWRVVLLGFTLAVFFLAIGRNYDWKSGWIPPLFAAAIIFVLCYPRIGLVIAIGSIPYFLKLSARLISSDQYSYDTRLAAWQIVLNQIVSVSPLLGLGPANYRFYTSLFPILGYYTAFNSHNNYVDIIAQTGFLGLIFFLWFAWEVGRLGWRLRKQVPEGFAKAYAIGALGGLGGMLLAGMLGDWVIPFVYNVGLNGFRASVIGWIFLGGLVAIDQVYKSQIGEQE